MAALICPRCQKNKKCTTKLGRTYPYCRTCSRALRAEYREKNLELVKKQKKIDRVKNSETHWAGQLRNKYGMSVDQYKQMETAQNGLCKICGSNHGGHYSKTGVPKRLAVDHCHKTGKIRGLLCCHCNMALGQIKENEKIAQSMINYIKTVCKGE